MKPFRIIFYVAVIAVASAAVSYLFGCTSATAASSQASDPYCTISPLSEGASGVNVTLLQEILEKQDVYPSGSITGSYDANTTAAVKAFQVKYGLASTGSVGQETADLLNQKVPLYFPECVSSAPLNEPVEAPPPVAHSATAAPVSSVQASSAAIPITIVSAPSCTLPSLSQGDRGDPVSLLQRLLYADGVYPQDLITGYYGSLTTAAVSRFQAQHDLPQVGRVGPLTKATMSPEIPEDIPGCASVQSATTVAIASVPAPVVASAPQIVMVPSTHTQIDYPISTSDVSSFTISASASPVGAGSVSNTVSVVSGSSPTLTATANPGYAFLAWMENGATTSTSNPYTMTDVTADHALVADFASTADSSSSPPDYAYVFDGTTPALVWDLSANNFDPTVGELETFPHTDYGIYYLGDQITITSTNSTCNSAIRIFDMRNNTVYSGPGGVIPPLPQGHYFVECSGDRDQFVILPADYHGSSLIGIDADDGGNSAYTSRVDRIQPGWVRGFPLWSQVEPEPNVWDWTSTDQEVNAAGNQGRKLIIGAFYRPSWLTDDSQFLPDFVQYATALAQRYDGKVYAIQLWNEPWFQTKAANNELWGDIGNPVTGSAPGFNGTVDLPVFYQTLANLLTQGAAAVRAVDPNIKITGPDWTEVQDDIPITDGIVPPVDIYTYHQGDGGPPDGPIGGPGDNNGFANYADEINPDLGGKPFGITEFYALGVSALGIPNTDPYNWNTGISWSTGSNRVDKTLIMLDAKGGEMLMEQGTALYAGGSNPNWELWGWDYAGTGTVNSDNPRGPHPKTSSFLMTGYWLNGATFVSTQTIGNTLMYGFTRPNGENIVFAWDLEGSATPLESNSLPAMDIYGTQVNVTSLGEEPALFYSTTQSVAQIMAGIQGAFVAENGSAGSNLANVRSGHQIAAVPQPKPRSLVSYVPDIPVSSLISMLAVLIIGLIALVWLRHRNRLR